MQKMLAWLLFGAAALVGSFLFFVAFWAAYILFLACGLE